MLSPGTRLGSYEIVAPIGAGGMGEVYRAKDLRLDRIVALKVLAAAFASDVGLKERFAREAKSLAALSHPHICPVFDVGSQNGIDFLVMEHLEGETLEQRLKKGALALDQALQIGIQIADALTAAHRAGIIHRDLKPGNIVLTKTGAKLLDFGLAKTGAPAVAGNLSMLPTTPPNLTAQGTILGTFQYMAPEQLEGQEADARTDIFAFGAVLYEMVTGRRPFNGKNSAALLGAILKDTPPASSSLVPGISAALDWIISRCLMKEADVRWQSASDLSASLRWSVLRSTTSDDRQPAIPPRSRQLVGAGVVALVIIAAALVGMRTVTNRNETNENARAYRLSLLPPSGATMPVPGLPPDRHFALSPDGRQLAFIALTADGTRMLWVRTLDVGASQVLPDTESAQAPFWSPDSRSIAFFTNAELKRVATTGGPVRTVCVCAFNGSGTWNRDNVILFSDGRALFQVQADGGAPASVRIPDAAANETQYLWPQFLPDGRHFIYRATLKTNERVIYFASLGSSDRKALVNDTNAAYAQGHLVFMQSGGLAAQPFDPSTGELVGSAFPVGEEVLGGRDVGTGAFAVSESGVLAYQTTSGDLLSQLVWVDPAGREIAAVGTPVDDGFFDIELSPDATKVAYSVTGRGRRDIWLYDFERNLPSRFTFDPGSDFAAVWSPDGRRIVFDSNRSGQFDLYQKSADGVGNEGILLQEKGTQRVFSWSRDGRFVLYGHGENPNAPADLWVLPVAGDEKPFPLIETPRFREHHGRFSPDGRWVAYVSNESGRDEIYVVPFPRADGRWQVSTSGGSWPRWRGDGRELFYVAADGNVMAVPVNARSAGFLNDPPARLFQLNPQLLGSIAYLYDVSDDGTRFLVNRSTGTMTPAPLTVVINWSALTPQ
jgi:eukaryotic-like serine/threonine-protein kinase